MIDDNCCLLSDLCLNSERIFYLLENRFKSNSNWTSFDFKSFSPEQLSNYIKVSRSLLELYPRIIKSINNDDENILSESSEDEIEQISSPKLSINRVDDDYLDKLAEWEPDKSLPIIDSDEEIEDNVQQMDNENDRADPIDSSIEMPLTQDEDLLVTFAHCPMKNEPMIYDSNDLNLPQLDGQTDFVVNRNHKQRKRNKNKTKIPKQFDIFQINQNETSNHVNNQSENRAIHSHPQLSLSVWEHMIIAEQKLNSFKKIKTNDLHPIESKILPGNIPTRSKSIDTSVKKRQRVNQQSRSKSKKRLPMEHTGKTLLDYFQVIKRSSTNDNIPYSPVKNQIKSLINKTKHRSTSYFDGCIAIDDDEDIQEIEQQCFSICNNVHTREKLLDHTVHSSEMRIKWLLNVELILLEHISIFHQENQCKDFDNSSSYHIDSSFISIIILNFLKIFIIRNSNYDQDELSFYQFGLTSYLHYLLIELPTYKHINTENNCFECKQYSLIINILFDLLFDLFEFDLCEIIHKDKYRSSLIEDDYFNQLKLMNKPPFYRIKLIIYFIELIGIHRNKCLNKKEEVFLSIENKIFQWIEDFIRYIIYQINSLINERISICLNVMELCLLFVNERENRIKQIALVLAKLCEENPTYLYLFLFDKNLLSDIRLLLINELIGKKFNMKFSSMDYVNEFFHCVEISLRPPNPIDDMTLLLIRSLFTTYADLIIDLKHSMLIRSTFSEQIIPMFRNQLESIYLTLINLSQDSNYFEQIKRTVILFRLLKCKWNRL